MIDLLALTVQQPWCWGLSNGLKPIENRVWPPPKAMIGKYLALHAGKQIDGEGVPAFTEIVKSMPGRIEAVHQGPLTLRMMPLGAITCVARLVRVFYSKDCPPPDLPPLAVPWWCGPYAWLFVDAQAIEPVPCRGMQKIWTVPVATADEVRRRWKMAREAAKDG